MLAGIITTGVILGAAAYVLILRHPPQASSLSLIFEKYGTTTDVDFNIQNVAFLWFTNASDRTYCLPLMGGTNTFQQDSLFGYDSGSYLIRWEFGGSDNTMPQVSFASLGLCHVVAPHSAVRVRVPLPPLGQRQNVAVLCVEQSSLSPRPFWTNGIGLSILRALPRSTRMKLLFSEPAVFRVWCARELSHPGERRPKR